MLLNKPRAYEIMDKYGLDGLVAVVAKNVYYLTGEADAAFKQLRNRGPGLLGDFMAFGVLPRREDAPAAYVVPGPEMYRLAHMPVWVPNVIGASYRPRAGWESFDSLIEEPEADDYLSWPERPGDLGALELRWKDLLKAHTGQWEATPFWGLHRALREAGLDRATIGTDDPRIIAWLNANGMPHVKGVDATEIFREIRMIKTPVEIAVMRRAAAINEQACEAAINTVHTGAEWPEIEDAYMIEMARQGGQGYYITPGPGGLPEGKVVPGQPIMLDALGIYMRYFCDIGRTAVVGEPSEELVRCNKAMQLGLQVAYDYIREGASAHELVRRTLEAVRGAGFPGFVLVAPHSVGLEHTDHPLSLGPEPPGARGDLIFHKNMVVNIDMPYHEIGWGGLHLEDTVLVTGTGCELLTSGRTELRTLPN